MKNLLVWKTLIFMVKWISQDANCMTAWCFRRVRIQGDVGGVAVN